MIEVMSPSDWTRENKMKEAVSFDDVLLVPQYSDIESRSEVNINSDLDDNITLHLPIISSPMDTITELAMAQEMSRFGGLGIIHRYNSIKEQAEIIEEAVIQMVDNPAAAIGVTGDFMERAKALVEAGAKVLCVDVAHGHHIMMKNALTKLKAEFGKQVHIMAGNVGTLEGLNALAEWGADSVRCGIGGGCFTAGTLVRTTKGDKAIEQVEIGDEVYTHTGNIHPVVDTLSFDRDEEIVVVNGIETTINHEFYVVNKTDFDLITDENIGHYAYWIEAEHLDKSKHLLVEIA
jgi:IMP dehydrogenase/GMP reductase